ncbi:MAG: 2OG-Fe(II) oxygenase, partial [Gammaproteobacteria bacterium]|nr:2OG-Fe(II) oxygenase [Gammaproteobacteria bacterium]
PSTLHRVKPVSGKKDRYSIALFLDPDTETLVEVIDSCTNEQRPKRFAPIRAGDYIQKRLRASHKKTLSKT